MCDALCVRTPAGMLFAKNSDRHPDEPQVVEWHGTRPAGGELRTQYLTIRDEGAFAVVASRPSWLWGFEHGVNEHGVAIGNEKIWTTTRPRDLPPALLGMDLVRLGLERGRTADHALDVMTSLLERHGQGGSGEPHRDEPYFSSFLVADAGRGWILETSGRTWAAKPVGSGAAVSNRVTLGRDWTRGSADLAPGADFDTFRNPRVPTEIADGRLATTRSAIAADASPRRLASTLRDHGAGEPTRDVTVCMHQREAHSFTTASMIVELREDAPARGWACLGNPCASVYVPIFPPTVSPELGDSIQWERFARLRDRIDADPGLGPEAHAELGAIEAELWRAADAAHESRDPARLERFGREAFAPIDRALRGLGV
jgi:secernin